MALVDLRFSDAVSKKRLDCQSCNDARKKKRNCDLPGLDNFKEPKNFENLSGKYTFCPAKSTWYPEIIELYLQCKMALETGILYGDGNFLDQSRVFCDVFPEFVEFYREKSYQRTWADVQESVGELLLSIFGAFKKGKR